MKLYSRIQVSNYMGRHREAVGFAIARARAELMERVAVVMGTQLHAVQILERTYEDFETHCTVVECRAVLEQAREMDVVALAPSQPYYQHCDRVLMPVITQRCGFCASVSPNDKRGNCAACGAPRGEDK